MPLKFLFYLNVPPLSESSIDSTIPIVVPVPLDFRRNVFSIRVHTEQWRQTAIWPRICSQDTHERPAVAKLYANLDPSSLLRNRSRAPDGSKIMTPR